MDGKIPVAVLGATGSVGQRFVTLVTDHPWFELVAPTASDRSAGKSYGDAFRAGLRGEAGLLAARRRGRGRDRVCVGRLRPCSLLDFRFTAISHNTMRGAAGGALLLAELLVARAGPSRRG